jgi:DNA replication protein DnaC
MTTPQLERLSAHCQRLRLHRIEAELPTLLDQAATKDVSYADFLDQVLTRELEAKQDKHRTMRISMARFPFQKTLETFDWKFQPSIEPKLIKDLATGRFLADGENVLLLGPPGVGKTHLAVAIGMSACALGLRTMFTTAAGLIAMLGKALYENRLEERLKLLTQPKLLIIDEIGYIPIDRAGGQPVLPAHLAAVRKGLDPADQQSEPRRLGRRLRGSGDRQRDPRPAAPPRHHHQHQRRFVSPERQTPRRAAPPRRDAGARGVDSP